ncbi:Ig-like domain (group 2) [Prevotella sp. khp7]|uniref:Ig-like domain-containing protein n=1 Tax=Prevotella sp. khp7 TaxID=1761885 RepID=UPI0008CCCB0D|nr:Ig-like domain-containing protein [Prevotella sp. khp7]SEW11527.1 Ig-like domain (group 2) [Prevotella sp. khp7]
MKLSIKKLSCMALLVAVTMMQTSCDELLGETDNPAPPVSDVTLNEATLEMAYGNGKDVTLEATVSPADTEDFDVTWSSSDESVATVDDAGVVHAVGTGTAVITAKAGSKKATCDVSVVVNLETPLTFEAAKAGATVKFNKYNSSAVAPNVEYSLDGGITWKNDLTADGVTLAAAGDKISFRGTNEAYGAEYIYDCYQFELSDETFAYGNVMSLINKDNYPTNKTLTADYAFGGMFYMQENLKNKDADHQIYLPAKTLTRYCYFSMFAYCKSLTTAPELPAKTLAVDCYTYMFYDCTSLTTAPELPAKTLAVDCYTYMFAGCKKLSSVTCKATDLSADFCLIDWLNGAGTDESVTTKTIYISSAYSDYIADMNGNLAGTADDAQINANVPWKKGDSGIPTGWTIAAAE